MAQNRCQKLEIHFQMLFGCCQPMFCLRFLFAFFSYYFSLVFEQIFFSWFSIALHVCPMYLNGFMSMVLHHDLKHVLPSVCIYISGFHCQAEYSIRNFHCFQQRGLENFLAVVCGLGPKSSSKGPLSYFFPFIFSIFWKRGVVQRDISVLPCSCLPRKQKMSVYIYLFAIMLISPLFFLPGIAVLSIHMDEQMDGKTLLGSYVCTEQPGEFRWQPGSLTQVCYPLWALRY